MQPYPDRKQKFIVNYFSGRVFYMPHVTFKVLNVIKWGGTYDSNYYTIRFVEIDRNPIDTPLYLYDKNNDEVTISYEKFYQTVSKVFHQYLNIKDKINFCFIFVFRRLRSLKRVFGLHTRSLKLGTWSSNLPEASLMQQLSVGQQLVTVRLRLVICY